MGWTKISLSCAMNKTEQNYQEEETKPVICCVAITKGCMFQCKMCHMWRENKPHKEHMEVDILYWKNFVGSLNDFVGKDLYIHFVGGESLINDGSLTLIKYASNLGCGTVLASNAYLIDEEMAKKIADSGLKEICLSLDSFKEETHDFLRGVKGSYQRVLRAIEYLGRYAKDVQVKINTVITAINLEEIIDLARWVIQDSRIISVNFLAVTQPFDSRPEENWYEKDEYSFLWPKDSEKAGQVMDGLIKLKEEDGRKILNPVPQLKVYKSYFNNPEDYFKQTGCHIYKRVINVSSNGQISMCFYMDNIGNIKQNGLDMEKLWNSSLSCRVRDNIKHCRKNCHLRVNCYFDE